MGKGALVGILCGAAIAGVLFVVGDTGEPSPFLSKEAAATLVIGTTSGVGAVVGTLIGAAIRRDRWETIPIEQLRLGVSQQRHGGVMLSASFAF